MNQRWGLLGFITFQLLACGQREYSNQTHAALEEVDNVNHAEDVAPPQTDHALPPATIAVQITSPSEDAIVAEHDMVQFAGRVEAVNISEGELNVAWVSDRNGELCRANAQNAGETRCETSALSPGWHSVSLQAATADARASAGHAVRVGICKKLGPSSDFGNGLQSGAWRIFGDAYWDAGGWLEMTGAMQMKKGAIFNVEERVAPERVTIQFKMSTGGGTGADGIALSVIGAENPAQLEYLLSIAGAGSGLGYAYNQGTTLVNVPALHVEFDTWYNFELTPAGEPLDPTPQNHIAVTLNGNSRDHLLWAPVDNMDDNVWHDVVLQIEGQRVQVSLDGEVKLDGNLPQFHFKGGYLGFSGTTGQLTNFHRIDDVVIPCVVP